MSKGKIHRDNRGLSLVELLISIAILGVIVVPIMGMFTASAGIAAKSRERGNITEAVQNLTEVVEGTSMDTLVRELSLGGAAMFGGDSVKLLMEDGGQLVDRAAPLLKGEQRYDFRVNGVRAGNSIYDGLVSMAATDTAAVNQTEVTMYTPMDAVFSQPGGATEDPDKLAATAFANEATTLSGTAYDASYFANKMGRKIFIKVEQDLSRSEVVATIKYTYDYNFGYSVSEPGEDGGSTAVPKTKKLTEETIYEFYRGRSTATDLGFVSMYVFYTPNYLADMGDDDVFTIENKENLDFKLFLIKQKVDGADENGYFATINLFEKVGGSPQATQLYTNISTNLQTGMDIPSTFPVKVFKKSEWEYLPGSFVNQLVAKERQNRMYEVSIKLFKQGADINADGELLEFNSTKLD